MIRRAVGGLYRAQASSCRSLRLLRVFSGSSNPTANSEYDVGRFTQEFTKISEFLKKQTYPAEGVLPLNAVLPLIFTAFVFHFQHGLVREKLLRAQRRELIKANDFDNYEKFILQGAADSATVYEKDLDAVCSFVGISRQKFDESIGHYSKEDERFVEELQQMWVASTSIPKDNQEFNRRGFSDEQFVSILAKMTEAAKAVTFKPKDESFAMAIKSTYIYDWVGLQFGVEIEDLVISNEASQAVKDAITAFRNAADGRPTPQ
jgi:hypothetical protein